MDFELKNAPTIEERKLVKSGASIVITLPKKWLEENKLDAGSEVIVVANGDLQILTSNKENVERLNEKIAKMRSQFTNHITRSDDDKMGEKRQAQSSPKNTKPSDSK